MTQVMLRRVLVMAAVSGAMLQVGCGGSGGPEVLPTRSDVSAAQLQTMMADGQALAIVDVRTEAEYAAGHIPGSINIPVADLEQRANELSRNVRAACVCSGGFRSNTAADTLVSAGVLRVYNLLGGLQDWDGPWEAP